MIKYFSFFVPFALLFYMNTLAIGTVSAQVFNVDTLQYFGPSDKQVDLVILGDGYTADELDQFAVDAQKMTDYLLSLHPFSRYRHFFNVYIVRVPSNESGAKHRGDAPDCPHHDPQDTSSNPLHFHREKFVPNSDPDNYFGSSFDNLGIHRLVIAHNEQRIRAVLEANVPAYDQAMILVNSPYYGGSGGQFPTATVNVASNDIAVHELGHSFANLADEYWSGVQFLSESANRTQYVTPDQVPWRNWLGVQGVGIYSYGPKAPQSVWYRPHEFCKMQMLAAPFCVVCSEAIVQRIHQLTNPIVNVYPDSTTVLSLDSVTTFGLQLTSPDPGTLETRWFLNGELLASAFDARGESVRLDPGLLPPGQSRLLARVTDTTGLIRSHPHPVYESGWTIINTVPGPLSEQIASEGSGRFDGSGRLSAPTTRWGDTIETCYGTATVLAVHEEKAGLDYLWYLQPSGGAPVLRGLNPVTDPLHESTTFYLEAARGDLRSERTPVHVRVLPPVVPPDVRVEYTLDSITVRVIDPLPGYIYRWYTSDDGGLPLGRYRRDGEERYLIENDGTILKTERSTAEIILYIEASDMLTTCRSQRRRVEIVGL